jgi:hypothetical protein
MKSHTTTERAGLCLPFFKQGDDLAGHLDSAASVSEALQAYAENLNLAAEMLRDLAGSVSGREVDIEAGAHCIEVTGPADLIEELIGQGLLNSPDDWDKEDDEEAVRLAD